MTEIENKTEYKCQTPKNNNILGFNKYICSIFL